MDERGNRDSRVRHRNSLSSENDELPTFWTRVGFDTHALCVGAASYWQAASLRCFDISLEINLLGQNKQ